MNLLPTKPVRPCTTTPYPHPGCTVSPCTKTLTCMKSQVAAATATMDNLVLQSRTLKNALKERWMDYHGVRNWEGLLDPLDEGLRHEIIRYGHFVEAAYQSCDFDPTSCTYATCRFPKRKLLEEAGFPGTGYRVTKNLTATSGIRLPGWADRAPNWMALQSGWIGFVAVCQDRKEIARLGRRDVVIALRGTATGLEWLENLRATLTPLQDAGCDPDPDSDPMVESGFLSLYTSSIENRPSLQELIREEIGRVLDTYGGEELSFTFTGHSLGAALATLAAYDIKETFGDYAPMVTVISFAGPRVGNWSFRCRLEEQGTKILRIVNSDDVITKVPGFVADEDGDGDGDGASRRHFPNHYTAAAAGNLAAWIQRMVEEAQWVYADVGCELRLSSSDAPDLEGLDMATCHDLKTYLHLINGFVSSNCPVRATARKIMGRAW